MYRKTISPKTTKVIQSFDITSENGIDGITSQGSRLYHKSEELLEKEEWG